MKTQKKTTNLKYLSQKEAHKYKNRILTDLYNSGQLQTKIYWILHRNKVKPHQQLEEDFIQYAFLELSKQPAEKIIGMFERNPQELVAFSVRIIVLRGVSLATKNDHRFKSNWLNMLLFQSNLGESTTAIDEVLYEEYGGSTKKAFHPANEEPSTMEDIYNEAKNQLSEEELHQLEEYYCLSEKKNRSKKHQQQLDEFNPLITKFKNLILEHANQ